MARVLIVGATSAIAMALARELAQRGDELVLAARHSERVESLCQDLRVRGASATGLDYDALQTDAETFAGSVWDEGLDMLLIAHGTLPDQAAICDDAGAVEEALQVNANSAIALLSAFGGRFAAQKSGSIVVISSVAGDRGRQSNYVYGAAKAAVSAYCQGLRNRLEGDGVQVLTVKPGFVDTPMTAEFPKGALWAQPETIARGILKAVEKGSDVAYLPFFWRYIMWAIRMIPERVFKRLSL